MSPPPPASRAPSVAVAGPLRVLEFVAGGSGMDLLSLMKNGAFHILALAVVVLVEFPRRGLRRTLALFASPIRVSGCSACVITCKQKSVCQMQMTEWINRVRVYVLQGIYIQGIRHIARKGACWQVALAPVMKKIVLVINYYNS